MTPPEATGAHAAVQAGAQHHAMYHQVSEYAAVRAADARGDRETSMHRGDRATE